MKETRKCDKAKHKAEEKNTQNQRKKTHLIKERNKRQNEKNYGKRKMRKR